MNSNKTFALPLPPQAAHDLRGSARGRHAPMLVKIAATALCLGMLAGCSGNPPEAAMDPKTRYPFAVDSKLIIQPAMFQAGSVELDNAEKARLKAVLIHFIRSGGGVLEIRQTGAMDDPQAEARLQALHKFALQSGAQPYEIRLRRVPGKADKNGPIILSFESFAARSFECTNRNAPTADNPTNMRHPDLGCSIRTGIAAMISNPADLQQPRDRRPGDGMRRTRVIRNYRAGEPTEATRGKNENSSSIRDLGG